MRIIITLLIFFGAALLPKYLTAQTILLENGAKLRLTGRLQVQYNTSDLASRGEATAGTIPFSTFETRRARIGVQLDLAEWIGSEIEAEFASRVVALKNAFVELEFDPRLAVRIGQFKKPFSLLELTSSTRILPIERGLRIRGLPQMLLATGGNGAPIPGAPLPEEQELLASLGYSGYDLGAELSGTLGRFSYQAGAFNGKGGGSAEPGSHAYAARLTYKPLNAHPLTLGGAVSYQGAGATAAVNNNVAQGGTAYEIDAEWGAFRRPGLHLMAEATRGNNLVEGETFSGAQVIAASFRPLTNLHIEGIEPLVRVSYGNPSHDRKGNEGWLLTPGFNLYFGGRNRLMVNWDLFVPGSDRYQTANALRAQAQIHF